MEKVSSHNSRSSGAIDDRSVSLKQIVIGGRRVTVLPKEEGGDTHAISSFIQRTAFERSSLNDQRAFSVIDLGDVVRKYRTWVDELPDIMPYYAVKCNDDPVILSVLARLGAGFDCASKNEIQQILDMRDNSVSTDRIIYANAVKEVSFIRYAAEKGVRLLTFDCEEELLKIKNEHPSADLVVRIREHLTSPGSQLVGMELSLSHKFGCSPSEAVRLVSVAEQLKLRVVGVSFHAGFRLYDTLIYERAIAAAKFVFDATLVRCGRRLEVLDIGGGFYGDRNARLPFEKAAAAIQLAISKYFGDELSTGHLRIIAEPGQYMTASASTLAVNVIGVRQVMNHGATSSSCDLACDPAGTETSYHYFLNDGAHGSFRYYMETNDLRLVRKVPRRILGQQATHSTPLFHESSTKNEVVFKSVLWGPTCDSGDVIDNDCRIERLDLGDWLVFEDMGFYSTTCSSSFNGMPAPDVFYVIEQKYVDQL